MALPQENLDNKKFEDLVGEARARIPVNAEEWTDHNIHDPGITFIELFAWLAEMQIYRLNRITDRSRRKFLKLTGIPKLRPARAAEVDVTFTPEQGNTIVPVGTLVAAIEPISGEDIPFEVQELFYGQKTIPIVNSQLNRILSGQKGGTDFADNSSANRNENVYYYAFSSVPQSNDALYLGFSESLNGEIILAFYLSEDSPAKSDSNETDEIEVFTSSKLRWDYYKGADNGNWRDDSNWHELKDDEIKDYTRHLTVGGKIWMKIAERMGKVTIKSNPDDAPSPLFWLRAVVETAKYDSPPKIDFILLNTVSAIQRTDLKEETFSGNGLPGLQLDLKDTPVLDKTFAVVIKEEVNGIIQKVLWSKVEYFEASKYDIILKDAEYGEVEDFDGSRPGDRHYTVDLAVGKVTFGNGINGRIPPEGRDNIMVYYRSGGGMRGNVKPHTITKVLKNDVASDVEVDNTKAASGGEEAETINEAIQRAKKELKKVSRAVTSEDFEFLVLNMPELRVARAKVIPNYHPKQDRKIPGIVSVIVVPRSTDDKPVPSPGFIKTVHRYLEKYRLIATEQFVIPPDYKEVSVSATAQIKPQYVGRKIKEDIEKKLKDFLHPIKGGLDSKGWHFGRSVYVSEIYEIIDRVEGVDYAEAVTLNDKSEDVDIPAHFLVCPGEINITVRE